MPLRRAVQWFVVFLFLAAPQARDTSHDAGPFPGLEDAAGLRAVEVKPGFTTRLHTNLVFSNARARTCSDVLARAQWEQDILGALDATAHFDNCRFEESAAMVRRELDAARAAGNRKDRNAALSSLGKALHAIQDFYSHTNYVEIAVQTHRSFDAVPIVPVWTDAGLGEMRRLIREHALHSGYVWWEPGDQCGAGRKTHDEVNKDKPNSERGKVRIQAWAKTHHQAARDLAQTATDEFLRSSLSTNELRWVGTQCDARLAYLLLSDNRKEGQ